MVFSYGTNALVIVRTLVLVPLYLNHISLQEYGAWLATGGVLSFLSIMDFGLMGVLSQQCASAYGAGDKQKLRTLIGTGLSVYALLSFCAIALALLAAPFLPRAMDLSDDIASRISVCFVLAGIANGFSLFAFAWSGVIKSFQRTFVTGLIQFSSEIINIVVTVILLMSGHGLYAIGWGLLGRAVLLFLGNSAWCVLIFIQEQLTRPIWTWKESKRLWHMSAYTFASKVASGLMNGSDRFLIGVFIGPESAGIYALTCRAHEILRSLAGNFSGALMPSLAHLSGEGNLRRFRDVVVAALKLQLTIAFLGVGGVVVFNESFMRLWIGSEMFAGGWINLLIGIWSVGYMLGGVGWQVLFAIGEIAFLCKVSWLEVCVRIALALVLIPLVGIIGAPIGALSAQWAGPLYLIVKRVLKWIGFKTDASFQLAKETVNQLLLPLCIATAFYVMIRPANDWTSFTKLVSLYAVCAVAISAATNRNLIEYVSWFHKNEPGRHRPVLTGNACHVGVHVPIIGRNRLWSKLKWQIKCLTPGWLVKQVQEATVPVAVMREKSEVRSNVRKRLPKILRSDFIRQYEEARALSDNQSPVEDTPLVRYPLYDTGHSLLLRSATPDIILYYDILIAEQYGRHRLDTVDTIVDCGANIGIAAAYFLVRYDKARVIALEPDPVNHDLCRKNLKAFGRRVTLLKTALWSKACKMRIESSKMGTWGSKVSPSSETENVFVEGIQMGMLLAEHSIDQVDILKMDIEGAEEEIFAADDLAWLHRVRCIQMEVHSVAGRRLVKEKLGSYGFQMAQYKEVLIGYRA